MSRVLYIALFMVGTAGCLGIKRVPRSLTAELPYEAKVELLESENELAIAIDKVDQVKNDIARTKVQLRRAKEALSAAEKDVGNAEDDGSREVAEMAVAEGEARIEHLRAIQNLNQVMESNQYAALRCAYARFEAAKLKILQKAKVEGAEDLDASDFDDQAKECEDSLGDQWEQEGEVLAEADEARAHWEEAKDAFNARASADSASVYVEF